MQPADLALGALIMVAQANYRTASIWTLAAAWAFGRKRDVEHLGYAARVGFWRDRPYLLSFRETGEN